MAEINMARDSWLLIILMYLNLMTQECSNSLHQFLKLEKKILSFDKEGLRESFLASQRIGPPPPPFLPIILILQFKTTVKIVHMHVESWCA